MAEIEKVEQSSFALMKINHAIMPMISSISPANWRCLPYERGGGLQLDFHYDFANFARFCRSHREFASNDLNFSHMGDIAIDQVKHKENGKVRFPSKK